MPFGGNGCDINLISLGDHDGREDLRKEYNKKRTNTISYGIAISIEVLWIFTFTLLMYRNLSIQQLNRMPT